MSSRKSVKMKKSVYQSLLGELTDVFSKYSLPYHMDAVLPNGGRYQGVAFDIDVIPDRKPLPPGCLVRYLEDGLSRRGYTVGHEDRFGNQAVHSNGTTETTNYRNTHQYIQVIEILEWPDESSEAWKMVAHKFEYQFAHEPEDLLGFYNRMLSEYRDGMRENYGWN